MRDACVCHECRALLVYPDMPCMDPPTLTDAWNYGSSANWTVSCHWLGPLLDGEAVLIRRGLKTDGGSVPQAAQSVVGGPFQMPLLPYYLEHDAAYMGRLWPRSACDGRLLGNMAADGHISWSKRNAIWSAVRAGGWVPWGRHTPEGVEAARKLVRIVKADEWHELNAQRRLWDET